MELPVAVIISLDILTGISNEVEFIYSIITLLPEIKKARIRAKNGLLRR